MIASRRLAPAMPAAGSPQWPGATWIGTFVDDGTRPGLISLGDAEGFARCRLLVQRDGRSVGFVELPVTDGSVDTTALYEAVDALPSRPPLTAAAGAELDVTVTISTRNRPDQLPDAIGALLALEHPRLSILIVDNASDGDGTRKVVEGLGDPRIHYVREDRIGLSYGRNRALLEATTPIVAFTDDDTVVDPGWITAVAEAFTDDVGLVTGMVPTGELRSPAQQYFEQLTGWSHGCTPRTFHLSEPPADIRAFPLDVGHYGTGANFAVRRDLAIRLGGFNEALGIGSPTHGGEDLDMFVRTLYAGWGLAYAPDAVVWHRHRSDSAELEKAVRGYSVSFTAWMSALVENPLVRRDAIRIAAHHARRRVVERVHGTVQTPAVSQDAGFSLAEHGFDHLPRVALRALAEGPRAYVRSRRSGRQTRPLLGTKGYGA